MPVPVQTHARALHAREIEQIGDESFQLVSLNANGPREVHLLDLRQVRGMLESLGKTAYRGERRLEVMRYGREQCVAQPLPLHADKRILRHFDKVYPFKRQR